MLSTLLSSRKLWFAAGLIWVLLLAALKLSWLASPEQLPFISRLNHLIYDARFSLLPPQREASMPIVIVDLDERSIQREGRWPWPRNHMAILLEQLQQAGVGLIGMDIVFSEPSRNPLATVLQRAELDDSSRNHLSQQQQLFDEDSIFAGSLGGNTVLGYFLHNDGNSSGQLPFPFYQFDQQQLNNRLLKLHNYSSNIEPLANSALEQGFVVTRADIDGVIRRLPLVIQHEDSVYAGLSLVMAQLALGEPWLRLHLADNGNELVATGLSIGNAVQVPLAADGSMLVPFRGGARSYPTISATSIMRGELSAQQQEQLQGALVLIGTSAMGLADLRTIVLQTNYPGVEVHANVLDALLQASLGEDVFYHEPDWSPAASLLLLVLSGVVLALLLPGRSPLWMLLLSLLGCAAVIGSNFYLWQVQHLALPLAVQLIAVLGLAVGNIAAGFLVTNQHNRQMQELFGSYVPPAYVERLLDDPKAAASMEGEQREMTVLFADIMGFTPLSEALTTSGLKQLLNHYLTNVTKVIFDHHGTIDKYVGDMGSHYRRAYTVLGDAVNLGSRLESITRFYGAQILVSDSTMQQCPDVLFMPVDRIQVKGKTEPVDVFEPLCRLDAADKWQQQQVADFTKVITAYRQREFASAQAQLERLLPQAGRFELLYQLYLERCAEFLQQPPADDWQAVYVHSNK